jgi:hypothetical protein
MLMIDLLKAIRARLILLASFPPSPKAICRADFKCGSTPRTELELQTLKKVKPKTITIVLQSLSEQRPMNWKKAK